MSNKERYLKFIKDFNGIVITDILNEFKMDLGTFYTSRYSLDNMQKITDEVKRQIKNLYQNIKNNEFILDTKEKNVSFVKDIKAIQLNKICNELNIKKNSLYVCEASDSKYELVIDEIKRQLDDVYLKYNT